MAIAKKQVKMALLILKKGEFCDYPSTVLKKFCVANRVDGKLSSLMIEFSVTFNILSW